MKKFFAELNAVLNNFKNASNGLLPFILKELAFVAVGGVIFFLVLSWLGPVVPAALTGLLGLYSIATFGMEYQRRSVDKAQRGRVMYREGVARRKARKKRKSGDRGILWGKLRLPSDDAMAHFCIVGGIGSGKTLTMQILMNDQFKLLTPDSDRRALIFDSKEDFVQIIAGINPPCPLHILNPFDERRTAWDIARDIDFGPIASNLAAIIFPSHPNSHNKFFEETPRLLLDAVLDVFIKRAKGRWTLRHVVLVMQSMELIQAITKLDSQSEAKVRRTLGGSEKSVGDVMSTINSKISPWARIAASWEGAKKRIHIREWLRTTSVLVLPKFKPAESETLRLYSLFVEILASNLSMLTRSESRRTWVFLDEFTQLGEMNGLKSLILEGRDKGFSCVLGTQQPGLVHSTYGKEEGEALISECGNKCFLKASSTDAANWVSDSINEFVPDWDMSEEKKKARRSYPPRYFTALPKAGFDNGMSGVYLSPSVSGWGADYTPTELRALITPPNENVARFKQIDSESLDLKPWGKEDSELFGIPWPVFSIPVASERPASSAEPPPKPTAGLKENPIADIEPFTI